MYVEWVQKRWNENGWKLEKRIPPVKWKTNSATCSVVYFIVNNRNNYDFENLFVFTLQKITELKLLLFFDFFNGSEVRIVYHIRKELEGFPRTMPTCIHANVFHFYCYTLNMWCYILGILRRNCWTARRTKSTKEIENRLSDSSHRDLEVCMW